MSEDCKVCERTDPDPEAEWDAAKRRNLGNGAGLHRMAIRIRRLGRRVQPVQAWAPGQLSASEDEGKVPGSERQKEHL